MGKPVELLSNVRPPCRHFQYKRMACHEKEMQTKSITPMAYELVILFLFPLFLLILSIKVVFSKRTRLPPSPLKLPLIGNVHQIGALPHRSLHALAEKHGPIMLMHFCQVPTLVISSAELAREILKTHDLNFASRPSLKASTIVLHLSMSFAPYGEHWRQMRKIYMTHLLSMNRVQSYRVAREKEVALLMEKISQSSPSSSSFFSSRKPLNMSEVFNSFATDILCRVILGEVSRGEGWNKMLREMIMELSNLLSSFNVEDYFPSLGWLSALLGLDEKDKANAKKWDAVLDKMIEEHVNRNPEEQKEVPDFVDVLLSLQKDPNMNFTLTREHIRALLLDMFAAGPGTTSITLEWSMAELIRKPETMKKLQDEVRSIVGEKRKVEEEDISEMNYLKAVIKEVLRLHPPAPLLLPRKAAESCEVGGYEIPKHARVMVNAWAIARDPKQWEAPEEFQPERFLRSSIDFKGHDFQYIPFGAGRRMCPGMQLALPNMELALANIVHQFDWGLPDGMAKEDMEMIEAPGLSTPLKNSLYLVPKPCF